MLADNAWAEGWSFVVGSRSVTPTGLGPWRHMLPRTSQVRQAGRQAASKIEKPKQDGQIKAREVRIVSEPNPRDDDEMVEINEVVSTSRAIARANARGLNLILVNDNTDPPICVIQDYGKYYYLLKKNAKEKKKKQVAPKMKEVKMSYTIGDNDLMTHVNRMKKWFSQENPIGSVKAQVKLKGRTKLFEDQAKGVLEKMRRETVDFAKCDKKGITKEKSGDFTMMMLPGEDKKLKKELKLQEQDEIMADVEKMDDDDDE